MKTLVKALPKHSTKTKNNPRLIKTSQIKKEMNNPGSDRTLQVIVKDEGEVIPATNREISRMKDSPGSNKIYRVD